MFAGFVFLLAGACSSGKLFEIKFAGETQGTYYAVTYFAEDSINYQPQVDSILETIDRSLSLWNKRSLLTMINDNDTSAKADQYILDLFAESEQVSEKTDGAFDITVGPLVNAWGFGFSDRMKLDQLKIDSILPLVGFNKVKLEGNKIIKEDPGIKLDFNAIAQGYTVDIICQFLRSKGIENYLVDVGGELLGRGSKPGNIKWVVGIEEPSENDDFERNLKATISISDRAIATSGNYRKFFEENGVKFSHTIDPKTGYPVKHTLLSVTVITERCSTADAYATAFMVMGLDKAKEFLSQHKEFEAYFIFSGKTGEILTWSTPGIAGMVTEE